MPILLLMLACEKEETGPVNEEFKFTCLVDIDTSLHVQTNFCAENYWCTYTVFPKKTIDTSLYRGYATTADESKNSFVLDNGYSDPRVQDVTWNTSLIFELDANETQFSAEDDQLHSLKVMLVSGPRSLDYVRPESGCLQGEKQADGSWLLEGELTFGPSRHSEQSRTMRYQVRASE